MRRLSFAIALLLVTVASADAQIIQAVNKFTTPGEPEENNITAIAKSPSDQGITLLSQASAQSVAADNTQIGLQAIDMWISRKSRLYARLTLPVKPAPAVESKAANNTATGTTATNNTAEELKLSDGIIKQLVDPFGGIFNLSGGLFTRVGASGLSKIEQQAIDNGVSEDDVKKLQPEHGAFIDIRGGFKFIDLPKPAARAVSIGDSKLNVFYTGIAGLKVILPLYKTQDGAGNQNDDDLGGGLTLGAYLVGNYAADPTQSEIFPDLLKRGTTAFTAVIGVNLPTLAAITFSVTPWTNDSRMGKMFVFGFNVIRPKSETEEGAKKGAKP